jgi:hypothetical protein
MTDCDRRRIGRQLEVREAAAVQLEKHADLGSIWSDRIARNRELLGFEVRHI